MVTSPLTVVHVVASLAMGGLERVVLDLVTHADRTRFTPRVVCLDSPVPWQDGSRIGIPVACIGRRRPVSRLGCCGSRGSCGRWTPTSFMRTTSSPICMGHWPPASPVCR